ncbi:MAG: caspase family protein [Rhodospirillaceae bacterium]|jgi:hypothetical protein|nr:caspase family protein [Rhodospirillaceae bacterium]MBT4940706.1 caspase family protein [Rhodospirillaceae bacterium]MBT7265733.1 caspase family protein [Rhodospirillaceae bacterium]
MQIKHIAALLVLPFTVGIAETSSFATEIGRDRGISVEPRPSAIRLQPISKPQYTASFALVIGIDNYTKGWPKLHNAVKDAELIAGEMARRGFKVTLRLNPNSQQLKQAFEKFYATKGADPKARLFVWYAGHGHTLKGEGYLVPADAPVPDWAERRLVDFKLKALNMRRFGEYVRLSSSKHSFTVFDSCFGGAVFGATSGHTPIARLEGTPPPIGQFLTAGTRHQKVADDGGFRRLFIRALKGQAPADRNHDGFLTSGELGSFMSERYAEITKGRQTPNATTGGATTFAFRLLPPKPLHIVAVKPVDVWTYDKGSFERIIFDWPKKVAYRLERKNDHTRLTFEAPAKLKISPLQDNKLRNIADASFYRSASKTILTLDIPSDRYVHDFVTDNQIVLDVVNPQITETRQNPVQLASYPVPQPQPQIVTRSQTRSLPDIFTSTARILQSLQPRPQYKVVPRVRYREVHIIRKHSRWQSKRRHQERRFRRHQRR